MTEIETARLQLRKFSPGDLDDLFLLNSDPDVMRYIGSGIPASREQTQASLNSIMGAWEQHGFGLWAAVYKEEKKLIGFCGLKYLDCTTEVEVGYRLAKNYWGMGLATEGARASLEYGFNALDLDRIVAVVQPGNIASQKVLEKIGLKYERDGRYYNSYVKYYSIDRQEHGSQKT